MSAGFVTDTGLFNVMWVWADPASFLYPRTVQFGAGSGQDETATTLASPVQDGVTSTITQETTNVNGDTTRHTATVTADEDRVITEAGVIDDVGNMEIYGDFDAIGLAAGDAITFQIDVVVSRSV